MIVITRTGGEDWPDFWRSWKKINLFVCKQNTEKELSKIQKAANYKVCPKCGAEYAVIFRTKEHKYFNCFDCGRTIAPDNYNGLYVDSDILILNEEEVE
jgi:predicted RNA-binding Zn-ribbon protein involved in translation (DUF1610 family)